MHPWTRGLGTLLQSPDMLWQGGAHPASLGAGRTQPWMNSSHRSQQVYTWVHVFEDRGWEGWGSELQAWRGGASRACCGETGVDMGDGEERVTPLRVIACQTHFIDLLEVIDCSQGPGEGTLVSILRMKTWGSETLGDLSKPTQWISSRAGRTRCEDGVGCGDTASFPRASAPVSWWVPNGAWAQLCPVTGFAYPWLTELFPTSESCWSFTSMSCAPHVGHL